MDIKKTAAGILGLGSYLLGIDYTEEVPEEQAAERLAICRQCEYATAGGVLCGECGCILALKTKTLYDPNESGKAGKKIKTKCPRGYW